MSNILSAIRTGASRPVNVLPGDVGATFVRRLFETAIATWTPAETNLFKLVRSTCQCANNAANASRHEEAATWITLASSLLEGFSRQARPVALGYVKFNEAYVYFARSAFEEATSCLDAGLHAANNGDAEQFGQRPPLEQLRTLHYLHLRAKILIAKSDFPGAISILTNALRKSLELPSSTETLELAQHSCSRIVGELAIATGIAATPQDYMTATAPVDMLRPEASAAEYFLFRSAYAQMHIDNNIDGMLDFVRMGRMKTACWYVAIVELAAMLAPTERMILSIQASTWTDMPATLRTRLLALTMRSLPAGTGGGTDSRPTQP